MSNRAETDKLRALLEDATVKCSERCLYQSAKWAAEMLNSFDSADLNSPADTEPNSPMSPLAAEVAIPTGVLSHNENASEARLEARESHRYLMAKTYFDCREYDRCSAVFLPLLPRGELSSVELGSGKPGHPLQNGKRSGDAGSGRLEDNESRAAAGFPELSQKALFLALYAKYMAGEKRRDELSETILGPTDGTIVNSEIVSISRILEAKLTNQQQRNEQGQGWLEYLYGVVLSKGKNREQARSWLLESIKAYPFNWGAWQELNLLIESVDQLNETMQNLPQNIMTVIFHIFANQELYQRSEELLTELEKFQLIFRHSSFLKAQKALLYLHAKDFERSERTFSEILQSDPLRLDDLNHYSNVLYVMNKWQKLAYLAQLATAIDPFRPETCCVVGNYYSQKSEHEKAVVYFRRALTLDRSFLSAWTLMGHAYVELKNTHAAIESYRRAVDTNRKDFRAWYGLGQTYEILDMHFYALYYFERASALASHDSTMWSAVANCNANMGRPNPAIQAYKRALLTDNVYDAAGSFGSQRSGRSMRGQIMDPDILYEIAKLYDQIGGEEETKAYLRLTLAQEEGVLSDDDGASAFGASTGSGTWTSERARGVGVTVTTSKARMWLAKLEIASTELGSKQRALELLSDLCRDGYEVEEAKALMRTIRLMMEGDAIFET